jgi:hypothetical protein
MLVNYAIDMDMDFHAEESVESIQFCVKNAIFIFQIGHVLNFIIKRAQREEAEFAICVFTVNNVIKW